ncbi:putative malate dehydrogenase (oxaloacetate-decarboxylating) (NADP(+)) [Helianthus annuus]|nr:putative malate dehydrogenase (oxaloacetate-decarboxylating) (NADP(+)) [Helianthus annuus]
MPRERLGRAIFASGSPFAPVDYNGKNYVSGQSNNAYIFPGFGLGLIISGAIRVHDDMLLAASEALAEQVTPEHFANGLIYPPFTNIRKISAHIAARVAAKAYELGKTSLHIGPDQQNKKNRASAAIFCWGLGFRVSDSFLDPGVQKSVQTELKPDRAPIKYYLVQNHFFFYLRAKCHFVSLWLSSKGFFFTS